MPPPSREALWSAGTDEAVEVNQRALIDKILARYSAEHTIFRELLQNADDAGAQHVQVKFYTQRGLAAHDRGEQAPLPDAKNDLIAEGNPDEEKIGAFGVGFYSLWSVCDDPFVESGDKWMGFYWKDGKDQLVARSGDLPPASGAAAPEASLSGNPWTTFTMALREPSLLEGPLDFARFLVTSLTFMRTIKKIDMVVDDTKVLEVRNDIIGQNAVTRHGLKTSSNTGMMNVQRVDATNMVITARVFKWLSATEVIQPAIPPSISKQVNKATGLLASFFGRTTHTPTPEPPTPPPPEEDLTEVDVLARAIQTFRADIKVTVSTSYARELERSTKKPPPSRMPASLVFSREDEAPQTAEGEAARSKKAATVFSGLCPPLESDRHARIFIGQPTSQTTGIGGHLAARFIPTVERESIDLVDKHVAVWNRELLWVGGYLARLVYEQELAILAGRWAQTTATQGPARAAILARGVHALRFFSFRPTTPSPAVGAEMESAFFDCGKLNSTLPIISTDGIREISKVRIPNAQLGQFVPDLAVLTPETVSDAPRAIARLRERSLLKDIDFEDVVKQLDVRPLTEQEMIACLDWWQSIAALSGYTPQVRTRLLSATILITETGKVVPLSTVKTYVNPQSSSIPPDMPLPPTTIPYSVTKQLKAGSLTNVFHWDELTLPRYLEYLTTPPMSGDDKANPETNIRVSSDFAERVLNLVGRAWQSMNAAKHAACVMALKDVACIPTRAGFKKPGEAYFEKNLLFDDLPTISFRKTTHIRGGMEAMLLALGVRRTVDLQLVFSRLVSGGEWTCIDLMKYLVSVKDSLSPEEVARLKETAAFPLSQSPQKDGSKAPVVRRKPKDLYEPTDKMRDLGLPLLDWGDHKWKPGSDEAKYLFSLGLRRFPPEDKLLAIAAGPEPASSLALEYLLEFKDTQYSAFIPYQYIGVPFIPATAPDGRQIMALPGTVFTNPQCQILGFATPRGLAAMPANAFKLGIQQHPPMHKLLATFMQAPPTDHNKARATFEYLASQVGHAAVSDLDRLRTVCWIPVDSKAVGGSRLARPDEVFLSSRGAPSLYASAFTFVDFGEKANSFLRHCGVRSEPSHKDIARLLLREPERMLQQAGSAEKYLEQVRIVAANSGTLDSGTLAAMKEAPFLLGSQMVLKEKRTGEHSDDFRREWVLCKAKEAVIVDQAAFHFFFGKHVLAVPEEQILEKFYSMLGSRQLSNQVIADYVTNGVQSGTSKEAAANRKHILERLTIFLGERKDANYTAEWLEKGDNFVVREATNIKVRYTYKGLGSTHQHVEMLYAMAENVPRSKAIVLTLSTTAQPDFYDVALALCRVLLKSYKNEDPMLLDSLLSTQLVALRKRGYNVDRILNQQHEERLRLRAERERERAVEARAAKEAEANGAMVTAAAKSSNGYPNDKVQGISGGHSPQTSLDAPRMPGGFFNSLRKISRGSQPPAYSDATGPAGAATSMGGGLKPQVPISTARPTGLDQIRNAARQAVAASRPGGGAMTIESTRRNVPHAPEGQQEYCDPSAEANIRLARNNGADSCRVWLPIDQLNWEGDQAGQSQRFIDQILLPLTKVFNISPTVLNVFWDRGGPLIAFNRNGTLFCNGRYFAHWHDESIKRGDRVEALISWYHTLAHELAHNLESAHNASHEFYFSSILEEYFVPFAKLIAAESASN